MSISDFSAAVKSQAYKDFFQRISTETILKSSASELRSKESTAEKTAFYITEETIGDIISKIQESPATKEQVDAVFNNLKGRTLDKSKRAVELKKPYVEGKAVYYPRISFDNITVVLNNAFKDVLSKNPTKSIGSFFEKGHVFGLFPRKVEDLAARIARSDNITQKHKDSLLGVLKALAAELERQDLETSNLKDADQYELYAKYRKSKNKYLVEMQVKEINRSAGTKQSEVSKAFRKLFNPGQLITNAQGGIKFTEGTGSKLMETLIKSQGSPSYLDLLHGAISLAISSGKEETKEYSIPDTKIEEKKPNINTQNVSKEIKADKAKVKKAISNLNRSKIVPKILPSIIPTLDVLLRARIQDQVEKNMGTGSSTNVLNYRTGRFSESVKIDYLTQSKQGMISVFYNYMKYPYATFSAGGEQSRPASRDPKLLISKSIREIAAELAITKIRSVSS